MQLLYLALFGIALFALMTFLRRWADSFIMIAFAIGCYVGSNLYNGLTAGFEIGGMIFSIDSILYIMFIHLVAVKYLHYSKKDARLFVYSSLVAVIISALFEFFAGIISSGYSLELLQSLLCYFVSVIGSLVGITVMELFFKGVNGKVSNYISLPIGILIASFLNSTIYYGGTFIIYQSINSFSWPMLYGSYIGKAFAICLAELSYFMNSEKLWYPNELKLKDK